jgi:predicted dehydrogenase
MVEKVRVAVVGCGYWGPNLVRNFQALPEAQLVACCDLDQAALTRMGQLYPHARLISEAEQLFADPTVDAVAIATPARSHYALARAALLAGKHVLVEKPLAMTSGEARALTELAREQGRVLMVGHVFEYHPAVQYIKGMLDAGDLGQVFYLYSTRVNLGRVQQDINALWSIAPHDISILLYLLGQMPEKVSAQGASFLNGRVEDVVFLTLTFPRSVLAHVHVSWLDPSKARRLTIVGSRKMVVYDDVADEGKVKVYDKGVYRKGDEIFGEFQYRVHAGDIAIPKIDMTEPLRLECAHFLDCVREGKEPRTGGENGERVVRVLEAAQASLDQGGTTVMIPAAGTEGRPQRASEDNLERSGGLWNSAS